jgi:outer membrane protein
MCFKSWLWPMGLISSLAVSGFAPQGHAKLPADAQKALELLPGKALSTPYVVGRAAAVSESFKAVQAQGALIPAAEMAAESVFAPKISATVGHFDDRRAVAIPQAGPAETAGLRYRVALDKYFSTGTATSLAVEHNYTDLTFAGGAFFSRSPYYETTTSLKVAQNLVQDSFGMGSRAQLRAARLASKAQTSVAESALEEWTLAILSQYYGAWLSQRALAVADDRLGGRDKLLRSTRLKERRGTAEAPDRLQVESVQLTAQTLRAEAEQSLNDRWRTLILTLKLPTEWMSIDPRHVPIQLDDPMTKANEACATFRKSGVPKEESSTVRMNQALAASASELLEARKSMVLPNVSLNGEIKFNGIEDTADDSISEGFGTDNPYWAVGLSLSWPLGLDAEKSAGLRAYADRIRAESLFQSSKDDLRIAWINQCASYERLMTSRKLAAESAEKLRRRESLEERRFQLGRVPVFNFIQAGDDSNDAELALSQLEVSLRLAAWQVLRIANAIPTTLESWKKQKVPELPQ